MMEQRLSLVTLGVADLAKSRAFYEQGLGWTVSGASVGDVVFIQLGSMVLSLYPRTELADDVGVPAEGSGFRGMTLAHNTRTKDEVDSVMALAEWAGAKIVKPAEDAFWGGYSGYFADPDGHLWEVAWNPHFPISVEGAVQLPA